MSYSQVNASAISNNAEAHLALGSVYLDVSLIRVQPPSEYHVLGQSLSRYRNEEAETGQSHETASKLGVLFDGLVPDIPNLIKAYGSRCSEIAKNRIVNPSGTKEHGIFESQVGADGTNIWAAATSGQSAIAMHLLACMLARMWNPSMATSIWDELISARKEILAASGRPLDLAISRISVTRGQIAKWDASARAWCLTADQANETRQTQLRLIIDNLGVPVNTKLKLSESVIDAWTSALITVDKLIAGQPQCVKIGASLLGLTAWHLYPDMIIFGRDEPVKEVQQNDHLVNPGGIMTFGIEDTRRQGEGIYWSLPLAHLRYYGDPVICKASFHSETSRVSIDQIVYVALGCLIRRWCAEADDITLAAQLLENICRHINNNVEPRVSEKATSWLELLGSAASEFLKSRDTRRNELFRLIKCGRRRFASFVDHPGSSSLFGLSTPGTFLKLLPSNMARISLLRNVAQDFSERRELMVIQCRSETDFSKRELFSVVPLSGSTDGSHDHGNTSRFIRWLALPDDLRHLKVKKSPDGHHPDTEIVMLEQPIPSPSGGPAYQWQNVPREFYLCFSGISPLSPTHHTTGATVRAKFLFGDDNTAALYSISITWWTKSPNKDSECLENRHVRSLPNIFVLRHIDYALSAKLPGSADLHLYFRSGRFTSDGSSNDSDQAVIRSLKGLATVWNLYQDLPYATVELNVASAPLWSHAWIPLGLGTGGLAAYDLSQEQTFACIAKFESGTFNFTPSAMKGVIAISSGNSLYVSRRLLQDPCKKSMSAVDRVIGNVGMSGMAVLVSPEIPRPPRKVSDDHALVNHYPFDSKPVDRFQHTSLHMTLTEWQLPLDVGSRGNRDVEAYYAEVAIGVYDQGKWVADVNVLDIFRHKLSFIIPECRVRHESHIHKPDLSKFVSIDSWEELLDNPLEIGVVRTRGNWQARLAAAAFSIQRGHETRILPDEVCWNCCTAQSPIGRSNAKEGYEPDFNDDIDDVIPAASEAHDEEEDSDSDMDERVIQSLPPPKRQKPKHLDVKMSNDDSAVDTLHRNIIYIL